MFTVCSKCNLRLTVTATDLRAAQGYVRCGRCHNVFNALAALADEPARPPEATGTSDTQSRAALTPPAPEPPEEPEPPPAPEPAEENDTSLEFNPASTNIYEVFIEATPGDHRTGTFETIVLMGEEPAAPAPADPVIAPQALSAPVAPTPAENEVAADVAPTRDALAEPDRAPPPAPPEAAAAEQVAEAVAAPLIETPVPATALIETPAAAALTDSQVAAITAMPATPDAAIEADPAAEAASAAVSVAEIPRSELPDATTAAADAARAEATAADILDAIEALDLREPAATPGDPAPFVDAAAADQIIGAMDVPAPLLGGERAAPRVPRWALQGACVALVLCLLVQVVHHYRGELADTSLLRRPLASLYQALGQPLEVRWDIMNYEIRQLGASTDGAAAGDLVVRASISNRATRDQPLPLLRVVMQDRFGNRVAARDLAPAEYLGRGAPQVSLMAPGQRVDVQVAFQDPGQTATGFEIDACMASRDHSVTCANDPGTH